jgi:hypothetical protein
MESSDKTIPPPPLFYLGKKVPVFYLPPVKSIDSLRTEIVAAGVVPNYIVMMNRSRMEERQRRIHELFPELDRGAVIEPSYMDRLLHFLNPAHNINQECTVSHAGAMSPESERR